MTKTEVDRCSMVGDRRQQNEFFENSALDNPPGSPNNSATPCQREKTHFRVVKALCFHKVRTFPLFKGIWEFIVSCILMQTIHTSTVLYFQRKHFYLFFFNPNPDNPAFHKLGHPLVHIRPNFRESTVFVKLNGVF